MYQHWLFMTFFRLREFLQYKWLEAGLLIFVFDLFNYLFIFNNAFVNAKKLLIKTAQQYV